MQIEVRRGAATFGPYTPDEVARLYQQKRLFPADLARSNGKDWQPLAQVMAGAGKPIPADSDESMKYLVPVGRSGWAIAAGYLGLFSVLVIFAPVAVFCGVMGLRSIRRNPELSGRGRCWFGIVAGALVMLGVAWLTMGAGS